MAENWTVHASMNQHGRDSVFRVTAMLYGADGDVLQERTWRAHDVLPGFVEPEWVAAAALVTCINVVRAEHGLGRLPVSLDTPLF